MRALAGAPPVDRRRARRQGSGDRRQQRRGSVGGLAAATVGATFSSAAPDMGAPAILSRFEQLSPKVLMANLEGRRRPRRWRRGSRRCRLLPDAEGRGRARRRHRAGASMSRVHQLRPAAHHPPAAPGDGWERFPFNHPLFMLFSSGTTGPRNASCTAPAERCSSTSRSTASTSISAPATRSSSRPPPPG